MLFRKKTVEVDRLGEFQVDVPRVVMFVNKAIADAVHSGVVALRIDVIKWESGREIPADLDYGPSKETVSEIESARVQFLKDDAWVDYREYRIAFHSAVVNRLRVMAGIEYWKKETSGKMRIAVDSVWFDVPTAIETVGGYDTVELRFTPIANPYPPQS